MSDPRPRCATHTLHPRREGRLPKRARHENLFCELLRTPSTRSSHCRIGPGHRQEKNRAALGKGISESARLNDDQIVVSGWPEYIPQMGDFFLAQMGD